jgi:predicted nuclease of predicted toxin-antitoxin system
VKFILDENVPVSVRNVLENNGHAVELIVDHTARGSTDPIVATVSEQLDAVLVTFDGDFQKIAPRVPEGARRRFKRLSRIWLRCEEYQAAMRIEKALSLIEAEYVIAQGASDVRMQIQIGKGFIRTDR